jgi:LysM repeat protein
LLRAFPIGKALSKSLLLQVIRTMNAIIDLERTLADSSAQHRVTLDGVGERDCAQQITSERDGISLGTDGQASTSATGDDTFIVHVLTKADTLAGLAVQYNVAVSDIKRANGLMSENMMWCRCAPAIGLRSF